MFRRESPEVVTGYLTDWFATRVGRRVTVSDVVTPRVGYSGETVLFSVADADGGPIPGTPRRLVARLDPTGEPFFPAGDLWTHFRTLEELARTDTPVPRPLWYQAADGSPFGRAFFLMARLEGVVPQENPPYTTTGPLHDLSPSKRRRAHDAAIDQLAALHSVAPDSLDLSFLPAMKSGTPGMVRELEMFADYADGVVGADPLISEALTQLSADVPDDGKLCINWGDPKFSNIVYDGFRVSGLLDWELATIAPPENDLAFLLTYHHSITTAMGYPSLPGLLDDEQVVERYEQRTGHRVTRLGWYRLWHLMRLAVMSRRLTQLLVSAGRLAPTAERAPHHVPTQLLTSALDEFAGSTS